MYVGLGILCRSIGLRMHKKERERERETCNERETELAREIAMLPSGLRQLIIGHV